MAEALLRYHLAEQNLKATVLSRGLAAPVGRSPHEHARKIAEARGVPIRSDKRASSVTGGDMAAASVIFVMDNEHRRDIQKNYPGSAGKTFLLGQWQNCEILDPIDKPESFFESVWAQCDEGAREWVGRLKKVGMLS